MVINSYSDINREDKTLRPYQQKAKREIFEAWDEVDSVMFQMPTGTGKTRLFTSIINDINEYSKKRREAVKILIVAHRTELIEQIDETLTKNYHVPHNVIAGGKERNYKFPVNVASIQTLTHPNNLAVAKRLNVQFVIIDEAHHALAATYKKLWKLYPEAKRLGVTATPWRMNHQSFTDLFDRLVLSMPIKDFIKQGFLAPYKYFSLRDDSNIQRTIDGIELDKFGEYKESSMEEKMDIGSIRAQLLDSYLALAEGKKGIIYAINIRHAQHICKEYIQAGYNAVSIDSKTPAKERKELVCKFRKGQIDIIVNVDIFSEGFDCPDIEFIQLARPTRSLVKYLQQVGRGLRPHGDKEDCVILDNVGMYSRFGLPDARRYWRQHFLGKKVDEEPVTVISKVGTGKQRNVDLSEGTEDMVLIQDLNEEKSEESFDPMPLLRENNYNDDNFVFWSDDNEHIYEAYIQDDKHFIVSELTIDEARHCVYRNRVGKIARESRMFWMMEKMEIEPLKSITHYGANYTVFHYQVTEDDMPPKDRYFGYNGKEVESPATVEAKYQKAKREGLLHDYIDVPVSKATFKVEVLKKSKLISIYRYCKSVPSLIAMLPLLSDFGRIYYDLDNMNAHLADKSIKSKDVYNTLKNYVSESCRITGSDSKTFTVRCAEDGKTSISKYDFNGKLLADEKIAGKEAKISLLSDNDIEKLKHAFDKKATSYKYFWLMALLQIYKETQEETITYREILIKMVAKAWKYVFPLSGKFPQADQFPVYLSGIQKETKLQYNATELEVEEALDKNFDSLKLKSKLNPLLKNVPYRFLSPWIPFTSNDDVMNKSWNSDTRCPYELYSDHIVISALWKSTLIDCYESILLLAEYGLESYLKISQNTKEVHDFYNTRFPSLNQLLKGMKRRKSCKDVKQFLEKYAFSLTGEITPADIMKKMPESKCVVDSDGRKRVSVPGGLWSLKILDKLLSDENIADTYANAQLLADYGLEAFQKANQKERTNGDFYNERFTSLTKLLKGIRENKNEKVVIQFLKKYNFPLTGDITPAEIMRIMPDSKCVFDSEGSRRVDVPGGMWSLKFVDNLLGE